MGARPAGMLIMVSAVMLVRRQRHRGARTDNPLLFRFHESQFELFANIQPRKFTQHMLLRDPEVDKCPEIHVAADAARAIVKQGFHDR